MKSIRVHIAILKGLWLHNCTLSLNEFASLRHLNLYLSCLVSEQRGFCRTFENKTCIAVPLHSSGDHQRAIWNVQ